MRQIDLSSVFVEFPIYDISKRSLKKDFLHLATGGSVARDVNSHIIVSALKNINLSFTQGNRIGLIGHNGSGKTTLLRLLARIYEPTQGKILINGHVSAMLDSALGIELEFTGYENIYIHGTLLGLTKKQIKHQLHEIVELTGLGDYLTMPVRTYSSGMKVRLAFAISTCIQPDILLIDEVFGAGDAEFIERARQKMISLLNQSNIVVMATHSDELIKEFCNQALLLESGEVKYFGPVEKALEIYRSSRLRTRELL